MPEEKVLQQITYFRELKPPTLKQYVHRRAVRETMQKLEGETGVKIDPESNKQMPISAIRAKELLKGQRAEDLIREHPEWVEDYRREQGDAAGNKEA